MTINGAAPKSVPVKYVLYSHYGAYDQDDFNSRVNKKVPLAQLVGVEHLLSHRRGLQELLTAPGHEGILVLFYAPGFEAFLAGLADPESADAKRGQAHLDFAKEVADFVRTEFAKDPLLAHRVRIMTAHDLKVILGRVHPSLAESFFDRVVGLEQGIRYDTPKIPEAILRLRVLGNGVPVFRIDHGVLFRKDNVGIGDLGLFKAAACSQLAYRLRLAEPSVATFMFSSSYNSRSLLDQTLEKNRFVAWSRAFATRIYPALRVDVPRIKRILERRVRDKKDPKWEADLGFRKECSRRQDKVWEDYARKNMNERATRQYYGLKSDGLEVEVGSVAGLAEIGAHPLVSVISGALLCLSEGAILDLPPFSNFRQNVMWIDDHLKYCLHREMKHFTTIELQLAPGLSDAKLDEVMVTKERPSVGDLPAYTLGTYLPTLFWGTIMDAWITPSPILKCRRLMLTTEQQQDWFRLHLSSSTGVLPKAMLEVLSVGEFRERRRNQLKEDLERTALARIKKVQETWSALKADENDTFASLWATGRVGDVLPMSCFENCRNDLWKGIAPPGETLTSLGHLHDTLSRRLEWLIEDVLAYVKWTLEWPRFVQIVRSIEQGTFVGDLTLKRVDE